ncbi:hypothetical protein [Methylobacterium sp. E-045]|uniref:hypothetical protein n=1 Tax=Methylobacterium sp. E-045 TaxID=2836575 RepID=UPI001FB89083|nr:hypothetical protein [Methylobacterium sp. E-045]MCJ2131200.1 hypothetical protein [Methylobacterium sp. E-045]
MKKITLNTRFITSDFDESSGTRQLFDHDARLGAFRAYRQALRYVRHHGFKKGSVRWQDARGKLRAALPIIAKNYWHDFDYDDRKTSAKVKSEATKLINPLRITMAALEERPPFVRTALASEAVNFSNQTSINQQDLYTAALVANHALLQACKIFDSRDHRKGGKAIRFRKACNDLVELWEVTFDKKFPRNYKTGNANSSEKARGIKRVFISPGAVFVYQLLYEIGNRWVTVSQIEDALKTLDRER